MPLKLERRRLRMGCDARSFDQIKDTFTGASPRGWNGTDTQLELAIFDADTLVDDISNIESLTVEVKQQANRRGPALLSKTVAAEHLNGALTQELWDAGSAQHALVELTGEEFAFDLGGETTKSFWLVVSVITTDTPARTYTVGTSILRIDEDGAGNSTSTPIGDPLYLTASQSDARYERNDRAAFIGRGDGSPQSITTHSATELTGVVDLTDSTPAGSRTVTRAGVYTVSASFWVEDPAGAYEWTLTAASQSDFVQLGRINRGILLGGESALRLSAGDTVQLIAYQDSGSDKDITCFDDQRFILVELITTG